MKDPGIDDRLPRAEMNHDTGDDNEDALSNAHTLYSDSTGHDSRMVFVDESPIPTASVHPGAIRIDRVSGIEVRLHRGRVNGATEEEDASCTARNNGSSGGNSNVDGRSLSLQQEQEPSPVEGLAVQEPRLEDLANAMVAPVQDEAPHTDQPEQQPELPQQEVLAIEVHESPLEAAVTPVWELVHRQDQLEQQPVIDAVMVQGTDENIGEGGLGNNYEPNNNKACEFPQWWMKWVLVVGAMMMLGVIVYSIMRWQDKLRNRNRPTAVPMSVLTVPMSVIFNLLVEYIPDLPDLPPRDSAEYRALEWLSQDNGKTFTRDNDGEFSIKDIASLVQRYAMAVFYYETGFSTNSTRDWLSSQITCTWAGLECDGNGGTSIIMLSLGKREYHGISSPLVLPMTMGMSHRDF
jgi:hypothetical protein